MKRKPKDILTRIIHEIIEHDTGIGEQHGLGCACHDKHAWTLRNLMVKCGLYEPRNDKSLANFKIVLSYIVGH